MRTSSSYTNLWKNVLESCGCSSLPTFYQFVTNEIFKKLLKYGFSVSSNALDSCGELQALTKEEENALRHVAGYICRKVREKLEASKIPDSLYVELE